MCVICSLHNVIFVFCLVHTHTDTHTDTHTHTHTHTLLGCTPQAYKPCTCPALRWKKEPRVSGTDIDSLIDKGILHVWSKVLE